MPGPGRVNGNINGGLIQHNATQRGRPLNAWCLLHAPVNIYARDEKWIHALSLVQKWRAWTAGVYRKNSDRIIGSTIGSL